MTDLILPAEPGDLPAVVETLAQAFQTDPALSWILPDPAHRARRCAGCSVPSFPPMPARVWRCGRRKTKRRRSGARRGGRMAGRSNSCAP